MFKLKRRKQAKSRGFVLITTMLMLSLLLALLAAYYRTTSIETAASRYSRGAALGFYSAEAGLNLRAEEVRSIFLGFNRPSGSSPTSSNSCIGANIGSGDYQCTVQRINNRDVSSFLNEDPANPVILTIPPGERYQRLNAQEYRYTVRSRALSQEGTTEAVLNLAFKSRLVPLFQFAAFFNKDLEILPGPAMTLSGPVHTNGDLYLYSNSASLTITGQVTAAGSVYRGRKDNSVSPSCNNRQVYVYDPASPRSLIPSCSSRYKLQASDITPWNGMIQMNVQPVTVPGPEVFDPTPGHVYWDKADMRLVLQLGAGNSVVGVQVRTPTDGLDSGATTSLLACPGTLSGKVVGTTTIYNFREGKWIRLLDVRMRELLNCLHNTNWFGTFKRLDDQTQGGLVFHFTVKGPDSALTPNPYGVRVSDGSQLQASASGAPLVKGLTVVSDQAIYVRGDYNADAKIPSAIMADSLNILSNNWLDTNSNKADVNSRIASNTTINAAFLGGSDTTGGIEGAGGQNSYYSGGFENFPRFHENWSGRTLLYRGSFVSLARPLHATGRWTSQSYSAPIRDWNYDTSFNDAANLPPITPRFVFLKQELFMRDFEDTPTPIPTDAPLPPDTPTPLPTP